MPEQDQIALDIMNVGLIINNFSYLGHIGISCAVEIITHKSKPVGGGEKSLGVMVLQMPQIGGQNHTDAKLITEYQNRSHVSQQLDKISSVVRMPLRPLSTG